MFSGDFPNGPVVRTPHFQCNRAKVQTLVRELRSHMLYGMAKKTKIKTNPIFSEARVLQPRLGTPVLFPEMTIEFPFYLYTGFCKKFGLGGHNKIAPLYPCLLTTDHPRPLHVTCT